MKEWFCRWCGKHRKKQPAREQKNIGSGKWQPLCSYCDRKRHNLSSNPFYGLIKMEIRDIEKAL